MTSGGASGVTRRDDKKAVAASAIARWLHLAAAPTFAVMAMSMLVLDGGSPSALCGGAGGFALNGMAPMYFLMGLFHLTPWLKRTWGEAA
jgi:hypothetical protein